MNALRKANQLTYTLSKSFAIGFLGIVIISVSYQVLSRYVGGIPRLLWTEELTRAGLVWLVFLGAAFAFYEREHFFIDLLPSRLKASIRTGVDIFATFGEVVIFALLTFGAVFFLIAGISRVSTMSGTSLAWSYLAMPLSFFFMLLYSLETFASELKAVIRRDWAKLSEEA